MKDFLTVTQLNNYINTLLEGDLLLNNFWLKGEISGLKLYQQSGHMYFTIKDEDACISGVMFKSRNRLLNFVPEDGMEVLLRGRVAVFSRQGKYQFYVEEMQPYGVGELFLYLEKLKEKLAAQGYFDPERKKAIPRLANRVGVVTSQDGAALRDILRVLKHRHARVEVILVHSSVQGAEAPGEIAQGIRLLNQYGSVDVIIVGRGGGSFEDLIAFNSEEVVKAIYESKIPVISAVGHEVDFSLADLAADLRAATPTQAAQLAVPDLVLLEKEISTRQERLMRSINRIFSERCQRLDRIMLKRVWREPQAVLARRQELVDDLKNSLQKSINHRLQEKESQLSLMIASLDNLSPLKVLQRGYAVVQKDGQVIRDGSTVAIGDQLKVVFNDARLSVEVKDKERVNQWKA